MFTWVTMCKRTDQHVLCANRKGYLDKSVISAVRPSMLDWNNEGDLIKLKVQTFSYNLRVFTSKSGELQHFIQHLSPN